MLRKLILALLVGIIVMLGICLYYGIAIVPINVHPFHFE